MTTPSAPAGWAATAEEPSHPLWHRVAALQPRLRAAVRVQRRSGAGQSWWHLHDPSSGRHHRVNAAAWSLVGRLDGRHSVQAVWQWLQRERPASAPTQAETVQLLNRLASAELITADTLPDLEALRLEKAQRHRRERRASAHPLAFRVPLFDPSRLLDALLPLGRALFSPAGALVYALLMGWVGVLLWPHASELAAQAAALPGQAALGLWLAWWLAYPLVKALHELAHGLALRRWGGEVREMGVTLMLLTPVPYVDASAASALRQRGRRIAVGAAGIALELGVAALALWVWWASSATLLQQFALGLALASAGSALLINANPLLRFDGYHVLADALDRPNLSRHADTVVLHALARTLGVPMPAGDGWQDRGQRSPAESAALASYSVAAALCRLVMAAGAVWLLHGLSPWLAGAAGLFSLWLLLLRPLLRGLAHLAFSPRLNGHRAGALARSAVAMATLSVLVLAWPLPSAGVWPAVVSLPDDAVLRLPVDATLQRLLAHDGESVAAGAPVAQFENLALASERARVHAQWQAADVQHLQALLAEPALAARLAERVAALAAQRERLDARLAALTVHAARAGQLQLPREGEMEGHFFAQGHAFGHVLAPGLPLLKLVLPEHAAARLPPSLAGTPVAVRLLSAPGQVLAGHIERRTPLASTRLPAAALGEAGGGPVAVAAADAAGLDTLEPLVTLEVRLDAALPLDTPALGLRAWVRLPEAKATLAEQAWRAVQRLFLASLGAA